MLFDGWYGALYDLGSQSIRLAPLSGYAMWGCDIGRVFRLMADGLACEPGEVVLDVPAGGGVSFARGAPQARGLVIAADLSHGMLRRADARRRLAGLEDRVQLLRADAMRLPLAGSSVDRVLCFMSLHCLALEVQKAALVEFRRVLKPGAELVGTTLVRDAALPWRASVLAAGLSGFFTPPSLRQLEAMARAAGFTRWRQDRQGALASFGGQ